MKDRLSVEEQEALRKCSATINTQTRIGSILGGGLSVYGMYRRKLWPLSKFWGRGLFFGIGGIVVGMQLGLVSASISCVRIVNELPNPDHVMKALREVQVELQDARRRPMQGARQWNQRSEEDSPSQESSITEESGPTDVRGLEAMHRGAPETSNQSNVWQQIRGEGRPETAWDKLRKSSSQPPSKTAIQDSPFDGSIERDPPVVAKDKTFEVVDERSKQQQEFDRLLDKERSGEAEDTNRRRNKFGDYE